MPGPRRAPVRHGSGVCGIVRRSCDPPGWSRARRSPPPSPWSRYRVSQDRPGPHPLRPSTRQRSSRFKSRRSWRRRTSPGRSMAPTVSAGRIDATTVLTEPGDPKPAARVSRPTVALPGAHSGIRAEAAALQAQRLRDVLRQRHDGDAPAARHDDHRLRRGRLPRARRQRLRPDRLDDEPAGSSTCTRPDFFDGLRLPVLARARPG